MNSARILAIAVLFFLPACKPTSLPTVTIIENDQIIRLQTNERAPAALLNEAGITLNPSDRVLFNGLPVALEQAITTSPITLQVRRAINLTIHTAEGEKQAHTSAFTVGEALQEASVWLRAGDQISLAPNSPISNTLVSILPARDLMITSSGKSTTVPSSAQTVGEALAEAGMPLIGLDYSVPAENEPLPADGQIRVVRVTESMQLAQKPIPFESELQASADLPLDQTQILQPG